MADDLCRTENSSHLSHRTLILQNLQQKIYNNQIRWFFDMTKLYNDLTKNNEPDFSIEAFQKNPNEGFPNEQFSLNYLKEHLLYKKETNTPVENA